MVPTATGVKNWCHLLMLFRNIGKRIMKCPTQIIVRTMPIL